VSLLSAILSLSPQAPRVARTHWVICGNERVGAPGYIFSIAAPPGGHILAAIDGAG